MIKGYYVDLDGVVVTVKEVDGKFYNPWGEVLIESKSDYILVAVGAWEECEGYRVDEEYVLWTNLKELAETIECK